MPELSRFGSSKPHDRPALAYRAVRRERAVHATLIHPRFRAMDPPVILVGMHRSGTSMVAAMLGALGVYIGPEFASPRGRPPGALPEESRLNGYAEAADFFRLNELLLRGARATWARVEPFLRRRDRPLFATVAQAILQQATFGALQSGFLAPLPATYRGPWGWKDPRNSLTYPLWLRLFPEARILHVRRQPEAVATSLHRRALHWADGRSAPLSVRSTPARLKAAARDLGLLPALLPDPCLDREYCRHLCAVYVAESARAEQCAGGYLEVSYEEALKSPETVARQLARFTQCSPSREQYRACAGIVRRGEKGA